MNGNGYGVKVDVGNLAGAAVRYAERMQAQDCNEIIRGPKTYTVASLDGGYIQISHGLTTNGAGKPEYVIRETISPSGEVFYSALPVPEMEEQYSPVLLGFLTSQDTSERAKNDLSDFVNGSEARTNCF
ncbi:hypothetical protein JXC34_04000 [Candidatus Woesearchaeota archaeon]|nr:hypothetical protein [Candidatus Woesearchaeota archaeon]